MAQDRPRRHRGRGADRNCGPRPANFSISEDIYREGLRQLNGAANYFRKPVRLQRRRTGRHRPRCPALATAVASAPADKSTPVATAFGTAEQRQRDGPGAGAEIEHTACPSRAAAMHEGQHRIDKCFGVRAWFQRLGRQRQPHAVEITIAEDAMHRLARRAARVPPRFRQLALPTTLRRVGNRISACRAGKMLDEQPRIESRIDDTGTASRWRAWRSSSPERLGHVGQPSSRCRPAASTGDRRSARR
jgi:hypothetical protein